MLSPASLYAAFPPVERFEWHHTPKHGSRLNMAEADLAVRVGRCVDHRIEDKAMLIDEAAAGNATAPPGNWRFTTADARIKVKYLDLRFE